MKKIRRGVQRVLRALNVPQPLIWKLGIAEELDFWDQWLRTNGWRWPEDYLFRTDPDAPLQNEIIRLLPSTQTDVKILDVGSGPLTFLGKQAAGRRIYITATDPLAVHYNRLLKRYGIPSPTPLRPIKAEELATILPENIFDLACARNSLDHSIDPVCALEQMLRVVKPGGRLLLWHQINEGENRRYWGFHQWNFDLSEERLVVGNAHHRTDLAHRFKDCASLRWCLNGDNELFVQGLKL
ncbi:methyltransferase domain-containing protein [candidate division KSB1 bacterium]|nr:methyltransferase domain-containing protein [candidate division KSB1 bacterium]